MLCDDPEGGMGVQWEGGSRGRGDIYIYSYDWLVLLYSRNQYNAVNQLSSN